MQPSSSGRPPGADAPSGTAGATPVSGVTEDPRPAFYEPPLTIPATPGTVIRTQSAPRLLDPLSVSSATIAARRVMYSSRDRTGAAISLTGTVFVPRAPWVGVGPRPLVVLAPGTQGMADRCAPSRQLTEGLEYEIPFVDAYLTRGYAVALPDYQGLGTPGSHTYLNRVVQGRAVLDLARAAQRLGLGLTSSTPVGLVGYSQGGAAAAAAAELAASYAPELSVRGTVAGAVPADLARVADHLDGSFYALFLAYAVVGLVEGYDLDPTEFLSARGLAHLAAVERTCVASLAGFAFERSTEYTLDGRPLTAYLAEEPLAWVVADNRLGRRRPSAPVLVTHSALDDVVPFGVGRQLARDWCARGASVWFSPNAAPTHVGGAIPNVAEALVFFEARFAGIPHASNCWLL